MRKERGITLLALVVTIVILIILATVSINIVSKDGGVLTKAEQAKYVYEMSEVQQRFDMALLEVKAKNKGKAPVDKFIEHLKEREIIEPDSIVENPDGSIEVTTPDGWVAQIEKEEDGEYVKRVVVEGEADNLPVRITNIQLTPTTHDITVKLTVLRGEKAKYSYYYKQGAITDEEKSLSGEELIKGNEWKRAENKTDKLEIIIGDDIEQAQQYTVMVEALEGNVVKSRGYATARTTDVPIATGAIEFGELSWENGLAKVTVSKTTEDYHLQYQVVQKDEMPANDKWNTVEDKTKNEVEVGELDLGQVVVARLWDGYKGGASISSIEVKDEIAPQLEITNTESTTNSITVTILATDAESGMGESPTYKFYIKEKDGEYGAAQEDTSLTHTYTDLNQDTEYIIKVEVSDRAGKVQTKEKLDAIKTKSIPDGGDGKTTGAITFGDLSWPNKKANVSITKNTTEYQLQWKKVTTGTKAEDIGESGWTLISNKETNTTTATDIDLNETVVARLWDGRQGGKIASIDIKDGVNPSATIKLNGKTTINEGEAINATVTHSDKESGIDISKCRWILNTQNTELGTEESSYTTSGYTVGGFTKESESLTPTISTEGTYYLHVLSVDRTGTNKKETISGAIKVENPKPFKGQYSDIQKSTTTMKDNKENSVVIPGGFKIADDSAETVQDGIVIEDGSGNQFVWIPVSNINADGTGKIVKKDGSTVEITLGRYQFSLANKTVTLKQKGLQYSTVINVEPMIQPRDQTYYYQELSTFRESSNEGKTSALNATAKNLKGFVESVQKYHGYYIGRYEASFGSGSGYGVGNGYYKPLSKKSTSLRDNGDVALSTGMLWSYITQGHASKVSRNMYNGNAYVESDLINSYMWDTAMIFIQKMGFESYLFEDIVKVDLANTGTGSDVVCNIFNMKGNLFESTTEYCTSKYYEGVWNGSKYENVLKCASPFTMRGGDYYRTIYYLC